MRWQDSRSRRTRLWRVSPWSAGWPAAASSACRCPALLRPAPLPPRPTKTPLGIFPPAPMRRSAPSGRPSAPSGPGSARSSLGHQVHRLAIGPLRLHAAPTASSLPRGRPAQRLRKALRQPLRQQAVRLHLRQVARRRVQDGSATQFALRGYSDCIVRIERLKLTSEVSERLVGLKLHCLACEKRRTGL